MATEEEEKYFKQQELAARDAKRRELERAAKEAAERRAVAVTLATDDESLVDRLRELGFDGDTARVLDLLPLVHVAWADGSVTGRERASIMKIVESRGIAEDSEAWLLVTALLEKKPSQHFLDETLHLLRALGGERASSVLDLSAQIAASSGGLFGFGGRISDEERRLIEHIAAELGQSAQDAFKKQY